MAKKIIKKQKTTLQEKNNNMFINRREMVQEVSLKIKKGETAIVLQGIGGSGKSVLLEQIVGGLRKKKFTVISFEGQISAEIFLKRLAEHALKAGIEAAETIFTDQGEYKEKLEKLLGDFIYKQKLVLAFEDFDENLDSDGKFRNERLHELLTFLKDSLAKKEAVMLFTSCYEIPKFPVVSVALFSWLEFQQSVLKTEWLKRLDEPSLQTLYFEMGGFPRVVPMLEQIARVLFPTGRFRWSELRERVPHLTDRVLHKESENTDFSYLLVAALLAQTEKTVRDALEILAVYRGVVSPDALVMHGITITAEISQALAVGYGVGVVETGGDVGYKVPRFVAGIVRGQMGEEVLKHAYSVAARYFAARQDDESQLEARWHYLQAGMVEAAAVLTFTLDPHFCTMGYPQWAFDLVRELERHAKELGEQNRLHLYNRLGMMYALFGRLDEALKNYEASNELNLSQGNLAASGLNLGQIGMLYEAKGKDDEALDYFERALATYEGLGTDYLSALADHLEQIGAIHKRKGNYNEAFAKYKKALAINTEKNNRKSMGLDLEQLGRIHDEQGQFGEALDYYERSLIERDALDNQRGKAVLWHQMGNVNFVQGKLEPAFEFYQKALALNEKLGDFKSSGYSRGQIGLIQQRWGNMDVALDHFEKSLVDFEKAKEEKGMAAGHHQVGRIYQNKGDQEQALNHYQKAVELREKTGDLMGVAITYGQLGILFYEREEWETALRYAVQAYAIFSRYGSPNAELSKQNMLRIRAQIPVEKFAEILKEYNINQGK